MDSVPVWDAGLTNDCRELHLRRSEVSNIDNSPFRTPLRLSTPKRVRGLVPCGLDISPLIQGHRFLRKRIPSMRATCWVTSAGDAPAEGCNSQARGLPTVIKSTAGHLCACLRKSAHLRDPTELPRAAACACGAKCPLAETEVRGVAIWGH